MKDSTKKKIGIGAAVAAAAGAIGAAILGKKKNRRKVKQTASDLKSKTLSVTGSAKRKASSATKKAKKATRKTAKKTKSAAKKTAKKAELTDLPGIGPSTADAMRKKGIVTVDQVAKKTPTELAKVDGVGKSTAEKAIRAARRRT